MKGYRFGPFELDPGEYTLSRNNQPVKLQDLPFRLLLMLVERPGDIITREEVRNRLWPENTFVEFDNNLGVAIRKVREALGDNAEAPHYVATIPRRGYRFVAPVVCVDAEPAVELVPDHHEVPSVPVTLPPPPASRVAYGFAAAAIVLLVAGLFWVVTRPRKMQPQATAASPAVTTHPRRSVAVLGFRNLAGQQQDSWLSSVFAETLSTELGISGDLRMVSGEDVARARRELSLTDQDSLGKSTLQRLRVNPGADVVLLGSYTLVNGKDQKHLRLDTRLQDTASGETIAENSVSGDENDLLALAAQAGANLRDSLGVKTRAGSDATLRAALPANQAAARLYAEGRAKLWAFDKLGARDLLTKAVAADPDFPLAHAALSEALWHLGYGVKAREEAKRAVDLSAGLTRENQLLIEGQYRRSIADWPGTVKAYQTLFNLYPDSLDYGLLLASAQTNTAPADALKTLDTLRHLPPPQGDDARIDMMEATAWIGQDLDKSRAAARRAIAKGTAQGSHAVVARTYGTLCQLGVGLGTGLDQAISDCEQSRQSSIAAGDLNGAAEMLTDIAAIYFQRGDLHRCETMFREAIQEFHKIGHVDGEAAATSNLAVVRLSVGDLGTAKTLLKQAIPEYQAIDDKSGVALNLNNLGDLERQNGNLEVAETTYQQGKATAEEIDDKSAKAYVLNGLGDLLKDRGDLGAARKYYEASLDLRHHTGEKAYAGETEVSMAALSTEEGHPAAAEPVLRKWITQFAQEQQADDELIARTCLIESLLAQGRTGDAQKEVAAAQSLAAKSQTLYVQLRYKLASARVLSSQDPKGAASAISQVLNDAARHGYAGLRLEAMLALAELSGKSGEKAEAQKQILTLEHEARGNGYGLIARKAAALQNQS